MPVSITSQPMHATVKSRFPVRGPSLSILLSSIRDGLFVLDGEGRVTTMNRAAERLLGVRADAAVGSPAWEVIRHPELLACCMNFRAASNNDPYEFELFDERFGESRLIQLRMTALPQSGHVPGGMIAVLADVTREREVDRLKSEFISIAAHELRTPLTVILGYAELLREAEETGSFSTEERQQFIGQIMDKGESLTRIINTFLDLDLIEKRRPFHLEKTPSEIGEIIESALEPYRREAYLHRIEMTISPACPPIDVDRARMAQVMESLLSNAVKFSPSGGAIRIEVDVFGEEVEISVQDEGVGMSATEAGRMFDRFYRADNSATAVGGLGLGLSLARAIVEAHGGRIWVESAPRKGTKVFFTLPRNPISQVAGMRERMAMANTDADVDRQ